MSARERTIFGKYFLLKKLAVGGMGEIFLAKLKGPVGFEKMLVIKRILDHHLENEKFVEMFLEEARLAAQLSHSNIVQIYEMGQIENNYYLAMEYVHGKALRNVIDAAQTRGERIPSAHVIEIISGLCAGLAYAHNARGFSGEPIRVIHRDINPQNLLVSYGGDVKVIDFGIAKAEVNQHHTEAGTIKGKFVYLSPEQSSAQDLDKRSDIFSAGICLYETLTGVNPFAKTNVVMTLDAIQSQTPPPVSEMDRSLAPFEPIIAKALAKSRDERYSDASEMRDALLELLSRSEVAKAPQPLADYMRDLFEQQIAAEKAMLADADAVTEEQLAEMRDYQDQEHRSGVHTQTGRARIAQESLQGATVLIQSDPSLVVPQSSSKTFRILLVSIIVLTAAAAVIVALQVRGHRTTGIFSVPVPGGPGANPSANPNPTPDQTPTPTPDVAKGPPHLDETKGKRKVKDRTPTTTETKKTPVVKGPSFGSLMISSVPPLPILRNGEPVGQTIRLKDDNGVVVVGTGKDPNTDPFEVKVRFQIKDKEVTYAIDATPWAIVQSNGMGMGKTPIGGVEATGTVVLELVNPKESRRLRLTLHHAF